MTVRSSEFGLHRVLEPSGAIPQSASRLDTNASLAPSEVLIHVRYLNLDSASYRDFVSTHSGDIDAMKLEILNVIQSSGKLQNPRTGSGGMLVGTIADLGAGASSAGYSVGDRVATLISLTATPLVIHDELSAWNGESEIIETRGTAILPTVRSLHILPDDLDEQTALSVLDVCGAPAFAKRLIERSSDVPEQLTMLLLGGGKSAVLAAAYARSVGVHTIAVVPSQVEKTTLEHQGLFDTVVQANAQNPVEVQDAVARTGRVPQITLVCVNVSGCEHAALLSTAPGGSIVYFSMATSFTRVALGAESLSTDLNLYFGSGYLPGHADLSLELVRNEPRVESFFALKS